MSLGKEFYEKMTDGLLDKPETQLKERAKLSYYLNTFFLLCAFIVVLVFEIFLLSEFYDIDGVWILIICLMTVAVFISIWDAVYFRALQRVAEAIMMENIARIRKKIDTCDMGTGKPAVLKKHEAARTGTAFFQESLKTTEKPVVEEKVRDNYDGIPAYGYCPKCGEKINTAKYVACPKCGADV